MKKNKKIKVSDVFTPGGFPTITYTPRTSIDLEAQIEEAKENLGKIVVVSGMTKLGKTVLVDKVFPSSENIWINGGTIDTELSFWEELAENADIYNMYSISGTDSLGASVSGQLGMALVKGVAGINGESTLTDTMGREVSLKTAGVNYLKSNDSAVVVDDYHYIPKQVQKKIVRSLKSLIMHGLPVVFIAIPNRKNDVIQSEREMTSRIEMVEMPIWQVNELCQIAEKGFAALNVVVDKRIIFDMAKEAYGSPFLMQEFCKRLCKVEGIRESLDTPKYIYDFDLSPVFASVADNSGRDMFEKLKRGPRQRSDRKPRVMKDGRTVDIYGLIMETFKVLEPGINSITYEEFRGKLKEIIDDPPQKHEVTRVLDKIASISYTDTSSSPVIDWDKDNELITVTDPFFCFYLKWAD